MAGSIKWLGIGLLLLGVPASAEPGRFPPNSVLLFVASWCAPCYSELARLPAVARGAQPFRVLVVPHDDRPATLTMIEAVPAAQLWHPGREEGQSIVKDGPAAPFAKGWTTRVPRRGSRNARESKSSLHRDSIAP